jgi:hypothetical protein
MGLDTVEFFLKLEAEFGVDIPDSEAERILTVRDIQEFVCSRISLIDSGKYCITMRAFFKVRDALREATSYRDRIRPSTELNEIIPTDGRKHCWEKLRGNLKGYRVPRLKFSLSKLGAIEFPFGLCTVGDLALHIATLSPDLSKGPATKWTRETVRLRVRQILMEDYAIESLSDDARITKDLRLN